MNSTRVDSDQEHRLHITEDTMRKEEHRSRLVIEWKAFKRAFLKSPTFNPFDWIFRLVRAACHDIERMTGLRWRPVIPFVACALVVAISGCYAFKLRNDLLRFRWCNDSDQTCLWIRTHDVIVSYFTGMILFHYIGASRTSPGFWSASTSVLGQSAANDVKLRLLQIYGPLQLDADAISKNTDRYYPNPQASFCDKCKTIRPPRCHHCRICDCCVVQFDHHCVWLNNCIGHNNVRSFVLTLAFISAACWYGVFLLYRPFYEPIQEQLRKEGGMWSFLSRQVFSRGDTRHQLLTFPTLDAIKDTLFPSQGKIHVQAVVDIVFPFLFSIGGLLTIFFATQVKYILQAVTALEYRTILSQQYQMQSTSALVCVNPFDQRSMNRNWCQIMGSQCMYLFLPIHFSPHPPFIPTLTKMKL